MHEHTKSLDSRSVRRTVASFLKHAVFSPMTRDTSTDMAYRFPEKT